MKKRNLILTAALFAMTASLAACGGQKPAQTQPAADTAAESKGGDKKEEAKEEPKSGAKRSCLKRVGTALH